MSASGAGRAPNAPARCCEGAPPPPPARPLLVSVSRSAGRCPAQTARVLRAHPGPISILSPHSAPAVTASLSLKTLRAGDPSASLAARPGVRPPAEAFLISRLDAPWGGLRSPPLALSIEETDPHPALTLFRESVEEQDPAFC